MRRASSTSPRPAGGRAISTGQARPPRWCIDDDEGPVLALIVAAEAAAARGPAHRGAPARGEGAGCRRWLDRHDLRGDATEPGLAARSGGATAVADDDVRQPASRARSSGGRPPASSGDRAGGALASAGRHRRPVPEPPTTSAPASGTTTCGGRRGRCRIGGSRRRVLPTGDEALETGRPLLDRGDDVPARRSSSRSSCGSRPRWRRP